MLVSGILAGLVGCTTAVSQPVEWVGGRGDDLALRQDMRTRVLFKGDSAAEFAQVRVIGDSLYGWVYTASRQSGDSVAIPLTAVRSVEQRHIDVRRTLQNVVVGVAALVFIGYSALLLILQTDKHS